MKTTKQKLAEAYEALRHVQAWNNSDIKGFEDISPSLDMLKARRRVVMRALREIKAAP